MAHYKNGKTRADEIKEHLSAQEIYDRRRNMPPEISESAVRSVSAQRREALESELNHGHFREPGSIPDAVSGRWDFNSNKFIPMGFDTNSSVDNDQLTKLGNAVKSSSFSKTADYGSSSPIGNSWRGSNDTVRQIPEAYSPLWLNSNLSLPRDRSTINNWSRAFFALNPIVQNAISLHSTYPISKLNIKSKNRRVEQFFGDMIDELDLINVCVQIAQEYWVLGEVFPYAELDQSRGTWGNILIQNPDYITVNKSPIGGNSVISMRPDENLTRIINSNHPADIQQRRQLNPEIVEYIKHRKNIPLNNFNISHLARKIAPYETRGTGLIVSSFKQLMLFDRLRESKYVQADSLVNPMLLVKVGNQDFRPTSVDLEHWRNVFEEAQNDKQFKIFSHDAVAVETIGMGAGIYDISGDIQQCIKEIYIGLMVPSVLMDGTDTTYANGSVALDALRQRYMTFRTMLSTWLRNKIFAPIAKIQGFYDVVEGQKVLIVPEIDWNHMSLFDMADHVGNLMNLSTAGNGPGTNKVSVQTLYRSLGLEYEDEIRKMRYEDIQEQIRIKENESLAQYTLAELRALTPNDEIHEPSDVPLPGEDPYLQSAVDDGDDGMPGAGSAPGFKMPGGPYAPRKPMGTGGSPPKGPGGVPKPPGAPASGGSKRGPTGGGTVPGSPPPPA